jgi:hypothetical protein
MFLIGDCFGNLQHLIWVIALTYMNSVFLSFSRVVLSLNIWTYQVVKSMSVAWWTLKFLHCRSWIYHVQGLTTIMISMFLQRVVLGFCNYHSNIVMMSHTQGSEACPTKLQKTQRDQFETLSWSSWS